MRMTLKTKHGQDCEAVVEPEQLRRCYLLERPMETFGEEALPVRVPTDVMSSILVVNWAY